ncbi:MAG TPA: hypothetical protein VIJ25_20385 [Methylococcales bacterium]
MIIRFLIFTDQLVADFNQENTQSIRKLSKSLILWKVFVRGNSDTISWIVLNIKDATKAKLDSYIVMVDDIEKNR